MLKRVGTNRKYTGISRGNLLNIFFNSTSTQVIKFGLRNDIFYNIWTENALYISFSIEYFSDFGKIFFDLYTFHVIH